MAGEQPVLKELTGRIGKYEIVKPLGKGAMGIVYLAMDGMLDREVALKVMVSNIADDPDLKMRFEREARAVAKLSHPNVVNVFDLGYHTDGSPYMAMELLRGEDLQKTLRMGPMPLDRKVSVIVQVLVGLAHAHQAGIVHRDIKPANIFIGNDGSVKIMDFGVARLTTASVTGTGAIVGTADYMSPEQVRGARVDGRSDLFSVGCMFYEMLTGKRPFHAENLMAIFYKITHDEPNWNALPQGPEYDALTPILAKALSKNLDERYANATQFAMALRDYLANYSTSSSLASRAIEDLVDLNAPTGTPAPLEDLLDGPDDGTVDLSRGEGPTQIGAAPTVVGSRGATIAGATRVTPTRTGPPSKPPVSKSTPPRGGGPARSGASAPTPEPARSNTSVIAAGFVGLIVTVGAGVYFIANKLDGNQSQTPVSTPAPTPVAVATPAETAPTPAPLATAAPVPKFEAPVGKSAATARAASDAFSRGDYDTAIQKAQDALREDPASTAAQKVLDQARNGKEARTRLAVARAALGSKDFARARSIAQEASAKAPWDREVTDVLNDIGRAESAEQAQAANAAQARAEQEKAARDGQVNGLLSRAMSALGSDRFDEAISLYDEVLKLDPGNAPAQSGKIGAMTAKRAAAASANAAPAATGRAFSAGRTEKKAGGPSGLGAAGFADTSGVKSATQAADMPGSVSFELQPKNPRPGDSYKVIVKFTNEGTVPIALSGLLVRLDINGKGAGAAQPLSVASVAPGDTAIVYSAGEIWSDSITDWSYTATITGAKGETYRNRITWK